MSNALNLKGGALGLANLASAPSNPINGQMYYDSGLNKFRVYENGAWVNAVGLVNPDFSDNAFRISNDLDSTKKIAFSAAAITTGTVRTITMPDANVDLGKVNTAIQQDGSVGFGADQSMNNFRLINLANPTDDQDAATKSYVDAIKQGLDIKDSVRVATTANITLSGLLTVDGVTLVAGNRVLVKDQTTASANGIYIVAAGAWSRSIDANTDAKVTSGMFTFVEEGTVNGNSGWVLTTDDPIVLGTTALSFTQFSGAGQIVAGDGLSKTGNQLDVNVGSGIQIVSDAVSVDNTVVRTNGANAFTADQSFGGFKATNLADPTNAQDAATKAYVDSGAGANRNLSNLLSPTAINQNLLPNTAVSRDVGSTALPFSAMYASSFAMMDGAGNLSAIIQRAGGAVVIDGDTFAAGSARFEGQGVTSLYMRTAQVNTGPSGQISIATGIAATTGNTGFIKLVTGQAVSGDSGDITIKTGSASAVRGQIILDARRVQLNTNVEVNGNAIEGASSPVLLAGQNSVRRAKQASKNDFIEEEYIHSIALAASQTNTTIADLTFAHATYDCLEITYRIKQATTNNVQLGTIRVATDGTNVSLNDMSTETASTGITFSAVVSGANVNIRFSSGSNGATMRADVKRFKTA